MTRKITLGLSLLLIFGVFAVASVGIFELVSGLLWWSFG